MQQIKSMSDFNKLKNSTLVIIDFFATWCGPCRAISPVFEKLSAAHSSSSAIVFAKCDIDEVPDVASTCGIRSIPTFHFYKNGVRVEEIQGANSNSLTQKIDFYTAAVLKENVEKTGEGGSPASKSLRGLIDSNASKLAGTSNLSSIQNIISPPPAGYAIASLAKNPQFLAHLAFKSSVNPESLKITSIKDSISSAPAKVHVGSNVPVETRTVDGVESNDLDSESMKKAENVQSFNIYTDEYVNGTATLKLKSSLFSGIKSLTIQVDSNLSGDSSTDTKIGAIDIDGTESQT